MNARLLALLDWCASERARLCPEPFTSAASRALEAVDEVEAMVWDVVASLEE